MVAELPDRLISLIGNFSIVYCIKQGILPPCLLRLHQNGTRSRLIRSALRPPILANFFSLFAGALGLNTAFRFLAQYLHGLSKVSRPLFQGFSPAAASCFHRSSLTCTIPGTSIGASRYYPPPVPPTSPASSPPCSGYSSTRKHRHQMCGSI